MVDVDVWGCIVMMEVHYVEQQEGHERLPKHLALPKRHVHFIRLLDISIHTQHTHTQTSHLNCIIQSHSSSSKMELECL